MRKTSFLLFILIALVSCQQSTEDYSEENVIVPIPIPINKIFTVQHSIKSFMSYYKFNKDTVIEIGTAVPSTWDLAFESAGEGSQVFLGWASGSTTIKTGIFNMDEVTQDVILDLILNSKDWTFDDPAYINTLDSLSLKNWENGEIYIQNRGTESDYYYVIQFISKDENSYTFKYASAQTLENVKEATITRNDTFNYMYFSFETNNLITIEPDRKDWDLMFSPYLGWREIESSGEFAAYMISGALINNENGVRIAYIFDPEIEFNDIDLSYVDGLEFMDMKGAIGSNWRLLGDMNSSILYIMDPNKKYILKKYDSESNTTQYFKLQIIDYRLNGKNHYPTVLYAYLGAEY